MDKAIATPELAIADIKDGATIAIAGFSVGHRFATSLILALRDKGTVPPGADAPEVYARARSGECVVKGDDWQVVYEEQLRQVVRPVEFRQAAE